MGIIFNSKASFVDSGMSSRLEAKCELIVNELSSLINDLNKSSFNAEFSCRDDRVCLYVSKTIRGSCSTTFFGHNFVSTVK